MNTSQKTTHQSQAGVPGRQRSAQPKTIALVAAALMLASNFASASVLTWDNGASTGNWTTDANWTSAVWNNANPDDAIFGATGAGSVTVNGTTIAQSVIVNSPGYSFVDGGGTLQVNGGLTNNEDLTVSAFLAGTLTKDGNGNLTLAALETYTGSTIINTGTLTIGASSGLYYGAGAGGGSKIQVNAGATLSLSGDLGWNSQTLHYLAPEAASVVVNGGTYQHTGPSNGKWADGSGHGFTVGALGATLDSATMGQEFTLGYRYDYDAPGVVGSTAGGTLTLSGDGDGDLNFQLRGSGGLVKTGTGTWKLSNGNTYSGGTVVAAGTLALANGTDFGGGQGHGSITSPSITVSNGAVFDVSQAFGGFTLGSAQSLSGDGAVNGNVSTVPGSTIYPGLDGTYGTITFNSDLSMGSGAACDVDLDTLEAGVNDQISVLGNLTLNSSVFHIKAPSGASSLDATADYVLISVAGTISGVPNSIPVWDVAPVNAANFQVLVVGNTVVLRSVTGTPPSATGSVAPSTVNHFDTVAVQITVTPGSSPISSVVLNATAVGDSSSIPLVAAGGNVYTNSIVIGAAAAIGTDNLTVSVTDTASLSALVTLPLTVSGTNRNWAGLGSDENWSTSLNWLGGKGPGFAGDGVIFQGENGLNPVMDASYSLTGFIFDSTAGSFTVSGALPANTLTLTGALENNSTNAQTLNVPVVFTGSQTVAATSADIILGQAVSGSGASLIKTGNSNLTLSAQASYTGTTTVNGGTLTIGTGLYSTGGGPTYINAGGVLVLPGGKNLGWGGALGFSDITPAGMIINGGVLRHEGVGNPQTVDGAARNFRIGSLGATLDSGTAGETFSIGFRYDYPPIVGSSAGGALTLTGDGNGVLDYALPGSGGVIKTGAGTWELTRTDNSYTGDTIVREGTLTIDHPTLAATSTVIIGANGTLNLTFSGANTVGALLVNGAPMAPGTYSSATTPQITGSGTLVVSGYPHPQIAASTSAGHLTMTWPADYQGWNLQVQTNSLSVGLNTNWFTIPGSSAVTSTNLPVNPANPSVFYRLKY